MPKKIANVIHQTSKEGKMEKKKRVSFCILATSLLALFFVTILTPAFSHAGSDAWPTSSPEDQGVDSAKLADLLEYIKNNGVSVNSITIVRNNHLIMDAYFHPFAFDTKHIIHSCTKSVMSLLVGIAIDKGYIKDVRRPVLDFFPGKTVENVDANKKAMTVENLLTMTSGLGCRDSWRYRWKGLFEMHHSDDWVRHVLDLPMIEPPGTRFEYCNGASFLLSAIVHKAVGTSTLEFARKHLFEPLGVSDVKWSVSPGGVHAGDGNLWLKPHDMAKIGFLYLNKGKWGDRQIVTEKWVEASTSPHIVANLFDHYGYQLWIDSSGFFTAVGHRGQFIFVVPDKNLIAVFTSDLESNDFFIPKNLLLSHILPAAVSETPLDPAPENKKRLESLVSTCAKGPEEGFVWISKEEGAAKNGKFVRTASPAFRFEYPMGSKKMPLGHSAQVMTMKTLRGIHFNAGVSEIPPGAPLSEINPGVYAHGLEAIGADVKVTSNRSVTLADGTPAYRSEITWVYNGFPITTLVTSVFKEEKWVFVAAHPGTAPEEIASFLETLRFD